MASTESLPRVQSISAHAPNRSFVMTKAQAQGSRAWWVIDATGKPLGRLASQVAHVLRGKHKPQYTPHEDTGDFVIVVNADKVLLTGNKLDKKFYYRHSGIPGGFQRRELPRTFSRATARSRSRRPSSGMLPKSVLGRQMITKLKVYATPDHPHAAQKPLPLNRPEVRAKP